LLPDHGEVKVPAMTLTGWKNFANPLSGLFWSALVFWSLFRRLPGSWLGKARRFCELIADIGVEVTTARPAASASIGRRGNSDESWRRGIDCLYKDVLSPKLEKAFP
jgi:hypothetical protein